jgi:hypothetical protein
MFNILKFLGGFNIFNGEKLGKLVFYAVLIIIALTIYHKAFEPKQVTKIERQVIEKQVVNNCPNEEKVLGVRFNIWKLHLNLGI